MNIPSQQDLLKAGVHLGHLSRKWNPNMAPFIFMESRGVHIIDLNKTLIQLQEAAHTLKNIAKVGKKILFVATKKQAKDLVVETARSLNMPYMAERWLGGTLTNFITIRKLIKKLTSMDRMIKSPIYKNMAKKEQLMIARNKIKLERVLIGILDLNRLPGALVVVDIKKEAIAVAEANKLGIPIIALVDTNANPNLITYPIPSNDDAKSSVELLLHTLGQAITAGLTIREEDKALEEQETEEKEMGVSSNQAIPRHRVRGAKKVTYTETDLKEAAAYEATLKSAKNKPTSLGGRFKTNKPTHSRQTSPSTPRPDNSPKKIHERPEAIDKITTNPVITTKETPKKASEEV